MPESNNTPPERMQQYRQMIDLLDRMTALFAAGLLQACHHGGGQAEFERLMALQGEIRNTHYLAWNIAAGDPVFDAMLQDWCLAQIAPELPPMPPGTPIQ